MKHNFKVGDKVRVNDVFKKESLFQKEYIDTFNSVYTVIMIFGIDTVRLNYTGPSKNQEHWDFSSVYLESAENSYEEFEYALFKLENKLKNGKV